MVRPYVFFWTRSNDDETVITAMMSITARTYPIEKQADVERQQAPCAQPKYKYRIATFLPSLLLSL